MELDDKKKLKRFKFNMEVIRTACSILGLVMNTIVITHVVLKIW